jgi:hypothetical protein
VLYLTPLIKAKRRIERLTTLSRRIVTTAQRHPWLSLPLLPPHLLVRWLSNREYKRIGTMGYPLTRTRTRI